jgi:hypothetical protein
MQKNGDEVSIMEIIINRAVIEGSAEKICPKAASSIQGTM